MPQDGRSAGERLLVWGGLQAAGLTCMARSTYTSHGLGDAGQAVSPLPPDNNASPGLFFAF